MRRFLLVILIQLIFTVYSFGANITLSVDKNVISLDEQTVLHVKVSGFSPDSLPTIKNIDKFNYQYIGTSSNLTIINGKINSEKEYNFLIVPKKIGTFKIGPAVATSNGKKYVSNSIILRVKKSKLQSALKNLIYVKLDINKKKVKLNEQIILTLKIFRKIDVTDLKLVEPEFKGFLVYKLGEPKNYKELINGEEYTVTEIKYSLIPTITGKLIIGPFILHGILINDNFDAFFKNPFSFNIPLTKTFRIASNKITVKVTPLEKKVYAVGDYIVTLDIDKLKAQVGDTINLTVKIKGKGDLRLSDSIKLKNIKGLKYYYDKPQFKIIKKDDGIYSEKLEKIAIVPEKKGIYKIPAISLLFYNPGKKKYEYIKIPGVKLKILSSKRERLKVVENKEKKIKINDQKNEFDSIFTDVKLENQDINFSFYWFVPGFLLLIMFYFYRFLLLNRSKFEKEIKQKSAYRILKNNIKKIENIENLNLEIKKYFKNRFNINESATYDEIIQFLSSIVDENCINEIKEIFFEIEQLIYSGIEVRKEDIERIKNKIINVVKKIENGKK